MRYRTVCKTLALLLFALAFYLLCFLVSASGQVPVVKLSWDPAGVPTNSIVYVMAAKAPQSLTNRAPKEAQGPGWYLAAMEWRTNYVVLPATNQARYFHAYALGPIFVGTDGHIYGRDRTNKLQVRIDVLRERPNTTTNGVLGCN